jgi:ABC-type branched-subunit amino acid transport system substrate-binding protein
MSASPRRRFVSGTLARATIAALSFNPFDAAAGSRASAADSKTLKIGVDLPLSGGEAASNIPTQNAVLLAIEEANAKGLPQGYKLAAQVLDDTVQGKHDPGQGAQNVRTFISDPSVLAFIGPANSSVAKAQIPLANEAGLTQIAASTNVAETKDFPTPVGSLGFDKYGDTTAPILSLYKVQSSKAEFVSQIDLKE